MKNVKPTRMFRKAPDDPVEDLRELLLEAQKQFLYLDSKTLVDLVPKMKVKRLLKEYMIVKDAPNFNLEQFVSEHFDVFRLPRSSVYKPNGLVTPREHVSALWGALRREAPKQYGSLVALPRPYIVPGGRFDEQFYWDSYFIFLGLKADGDWQTIKDMMRNFAYMLRKYGFIPTANRSYLMSRSQPPFFALMVELLASQAGQRRAYIRFLPSMLTEYQFWMRGRRTLNRTPGVASYLRLVSLPNGAVLNRYYDARSTPRSESINHDVTTASRLNGNVKAEELYRDIRAAAESGWDFSSRWYIGGRDLSATVTTDIIPIDLNCLLYELEKAIATAYQLLGQSLLARRFETLASRRAELIQRYFWNSKERFFTDFNSVSGKPTNKVTLAGLYPLFMNIATKEQAAVVVRRLKSDFLKKGGLLTTLEETGQQWDSPNGWAPLHWIAIKALKNYGYFDLANDIRDRFIDTIERVYGKHKNFYEKYDILTQSVGQGGEYEAQDGFGWTNGVYAALKDEQGAS